MNPYRLRLDLQFFADEKTEKATPKKRMDARRKGQVAKSVELPGAFILLFSFMAFYLFGGFFKNRIYALFTDVFNHYLLTDLTKANMNVLFDRLMLESLILLAPFFAITVVVALLGNYFQIGLLFTGDPLLMKFEKLNPVEGAKRLFSLTSLVNLLKTLLKLSVIGIVVYMVLSSHRGSIVQLSRMPLEHTLQFASSVTLQIGLEIGFILIVMSVFDYMFQRYEYEKSLRMSKQDIKDEYKNTEGNPQIKGKIREKQRKMALMRMMQEVPKADVIITNPTHYAIAIQYDAEQMEAPKVIAKGTDYIALKIKQVAAENGIVTMENRPLARALHDRVEIGEAIPADLFQAVAEVLAYVYKMKGRAKPAAR